MRRCIMARHDWRWSPYAIAVICRHCRKEWVIDGLIFAAIHAVGDSGRPYWPLVERAVNR